MNLPDKLPLLDPNVRGIFDRIITTVAEIRQQRKTDEYKQAELRREAASVALRARREKEARQEELNRAAAERMAEAKKIPTFISNQPSGETLTLRESDIPRFVR